MSSYPFVFGNGNVNPTTSFNTKSKTITATSILNPLAPTFYPGCTSHITTAFLSTAVARIRSQGLDASSSRLNMSPAFFETEMQYTLQQVARPIDRSATRGTREEFMSKLASGVVALLNSLGYVSFPKISFSCFWSVNQLTALVSRMTRR